MENKTIVAKCRLKVIQTDKAKAGVLDDMSIKDPENVKIEELISRSKDNDETGIDQTSNTDNRKNSIIKKS